MPVPYLGNALKGWVFDSTITVIVQTVVDHKTVETPTSATYQANFQPMPAAKVNRKPEEQRTWKWWTIFIRDDSALFKTDDIIEDENGVKFRIEQAKDWRTSGYTEYEAVEDYT